MYHRIQYTPLRAMLRELGFSFSTIDTIMRHGFDDCNFDRDAIVLLPRYAVKERILEVMQSHDLFGGRTMASVRTAIDAEAGTGTLILIN